MVMAAGVTAAALGFSASQAAGAGSTKACGNSGQEIRNIRATNTTCRTAKKVVRADVQGKKYDGWKCHSKRTFSGAHVTCTHKGARKVTYTVSFTAIRG
jgi:hypothetical protein